MPAFLASIKKALVPLVVSGLVVLLDNIGVSLPGDTLQQLAAGIVNSVLVWAVKNG